MAQTGVLTDFSWETEFSNLANTTPGGTWKLMITGASDDPVINFILPDWQFYIDGKAQERKFYQDVSNLKGKVVEFSYEEYHFRFEFILKADE